MRPPYGARNSNVDSVAANLGYTSIRGIHLSGPGTRRRAYKRPETGQIVVHRTGHAAKSAQMNTPDLNYHLARHLRRLGAHHGGRAACLGQAVDPAAGRRYRTCQPSDRDPSLWTDSRHHPKSPPADGDPGRRLVRRPGPRPLRWFDPINRLRPPLKPQLWRARSTAASPPGWSGGRPILLRYRCRRRASSPPAYLAPVPDARQGATRGTATNPVLHMATLNCCEGDKRSVSA
jgi:hypothetical protein